MLAAVFALAACDTGGGGASPTPSITPTAHASGPAPSATVVGQDPLVTWSPEPKAVGERGEGWLGETLLVTAPGDVQLHVEPVSTSMTLAFEGGARSLAIWIDIENAGDADWNGVFGAQATLTDELGNTYLPVASPAPDDLHPDPDRYGFTNRNLMRPIAVPTGERTQGVLVFRPTLGNRTARLQVTLDGQRTTSWVVNIGQL